MNETPLERETRLISDNMGLVASIAKKFNPKTQDELDDLIQAGTIGLLKAVRKFDETKAVLSTWAYRPIRWEIIDYLKRSKIVGKQVKISPVNEPAYTITEEILSNYEPASLTDEEREILILISSSYNIREISSIMNITEYSVSKLLKIAADKIKEANEEKTTINGN